MSIVLTEKAATEVKRVKDAQKVEPHLALRVLLAGGGCGGFSYSLGFDEKFDAARDTKYPCHGVDLVVDKRHALYLDGTTIDWHDDGGRRGFSFDNPNVLRTCSCGH